MTSSAPIFDGAEPVGLPLRRIPGYLIRRAEQVHNGLWIKHVGTTVTSPQYAVLATLAAQPNLAQGRVGELASLDKSSVAEVVDRLAHRGWITKSRDPADRRRHILRLAPEASAALEHLTPAAALVQERFMSPLLEHERAQFIDRLLSVGRFHGEQFDSHRLARAPVLDLEVPGHLIRCAQQVHTAIWLRIFGTELTGPQYAILHVLATRPGLSQRELGNSAALGKSAVADLVDRLEKKGWLQRTRDPLDGRGNLVRLADTAARSLPQFTTGMVAVQRELISTLSPNSRDSFIAQLATVAYSGQVPADS
jgi:DNA-binding MarR family transcriptional regulator